MTALLIGAALALAVGLAASALGFDRDRAFYPTVMIVIASYYLLFAVQAGAYTALLYEALAALPFVLLSVLAFRRAPGLLILALLGHGLFDFLRGDHLANPGVPGWWPAFCLGYDLLAGLYLALLLRRRASTATRQP